MTTCQSRPRCCWRSSGASCGLAAAARAAVRDRAVSARAPRRSIRATGPFSPQYPLWTDGAGKSRWVRLPAGRADRRARRRRLGVPRRHAVLEGVRVRRPQGRDAVPAAFERGRVVVCELRLERGADRCGARAREGLRNVAEVAPGKRHSIPSVDDCRACHENGAHRTSDSRRCSSRRIATRRHRTRSRSRRTW